MFLDGESLQEFPVNAGVFQDSILGPTLFLLCTNHFPNDIICNIAIYADDTTLYSKCGQASEIWSMLLCGLEQELACWFQCWKNSTGFVWLV